MSRFFAPGRKTMNIEGSRSSALEMARSRLAFVAAVFVLAYSLIEIRVFDLTILQGELERRVAGNYAAVTDHEKEHVRRADIVDRNGVLLAATVKTASLYADPEMILDPVVSARGITDIFPELNYEEVLEKLKSNRRFVWIYRNLTPEEQAKVLELGDPGLNFKAESRRIYPQRQLTSHVAGFTDIDGRGLSGIERGLDKRLSEGGAPVKLSIDIRVQYLLHREMSRAVSKFNAKGGSGLVMDVNTGEIMAAVSLPDFDPNLPGKAAKSELFNKFTLGVYEPGSIFKIFSMAALIESGDFSMSDKFDVREPLKRDYFTIRDYHPKKRVLQLPEVFIYSSNIGSALIGERLGRERLKNFYDDLGFFDAPLYINIPETGRPLLPDPWRTTSTLTVSYGHGISVSPLQIISAVSTVIGDGTYVRPVFLCRDNTDSGEKYVPPSPELRVVSPETVLRMRQLMRLAVTDGTGSKAEVPGYQVGGKTGTAEKAENGVYVHNRLLSSFVGVFPMKDPKYAVLIMIDEPEGTQESHGYATGGWVAAPAVGHVIASMGALLGIPVQGTEQDQLAAPLRKYVKPEGKERHFASY